MRRAALLLPALVVLAACETPQEACLSAVSREERVIAGLIAEAEGNLSRGYAIEEDQVIRTVPDFCEVERDDGSVRRTFCDRTEVRDVERPVAINVAEQRETLDGLIDQRARLQAERGARLNACQALPDA